MKSFPRPFHLVETYQKLSLMANRLADEALLSWYIDRPYYERAYAERTGGALRRSFNLGRHYLAVGAELGLQPSADFCGRKYAAANPDVERSGMDPFLHYCRYGRREGRASALHELSSSQSSIETRDELVPEEAAVVTLLSPFFDPDFYLSRNTDVRDEQTDPLLHYVRYGWREGRDPSSEFSTSGYLQLYPDVASAGLNPLLHFATEGRIEGREGRPHESAHHRAISEAPWPSSVDFTPGGVVDDIQRLREGLESALARVSHADLYLTVSQDDYTRNVGGVQACLMRESRALAGGQHLHLHVFPGEHSLRVRDDPDAVLGVLVNGEPAGRHPTPVLAAELARLIRGDALRAIGFCVHSLLGHSASAIVSLLSSCGAQGIFFWLHDYLSVCSGYNLTRNDIAFCSAPPVTSGACLVCVHKEGRSAAVAGHERLFAAFDVTVVAPSSTALTVWCRASGLRAAGTLIHPHARLSSAYAAEAAEGSPSDSARPLRIAFVGSPLSQKGWFIFQDIFERFRHDARYAFYQLSAEPKLGPPLRFEKVHPSDGEPEPMRRAIDLLGIDVALVWSLWPETFCLSAYEAVAGGAALLTWRGAGHVAAMCAELDTGLVLDDHEALFSAFQTGAVAALARARRPKATRELDFSRVTVDLLPKPSL